jgi:DNA polymerase III subunit gamma/tau
MSEPFYTKYRPQKWEDVIGQDVVVDSLRAVLDKGHTHAFLITGPMGCGKTTIGRLIAKEVGCDMAWGFTELNGGNDRGIDTIRALNSATLSAPMHGKASVYLIDEAHRLTKDAAEALLKTIEDCPYYVFFVLCTSEPNKVIGTLKQRCMQYQLGYLKSYDILKVLKHVVEEEELDVSREVLKKIVELSEGSPRAALVLLEQVEVLEDEDRMLELLNLFYSNEAKVSDFCKALLNKDWKEAKNALKVIDEDAEAIRRGTIGYLSKVVENSNDSAKRLQAHSIMNEFMQNPYMGKPGLVWATYYVCEVA